MAGRSKESGKRPWLAALLGTLATGLGHFYLRRWKRGLGWFAAALVVSALAVPPEAARALLSGSGGDLATFAPLLAVGIASVADAYVLARMHQRETRLAGEGAESDAGAPDSGTAAGSQADATIPAGTGNQVVGSTDAACPECGEELDPELDFCPWCTTRLGGEDGG